jgi:hypothetical protein
MAEQLAAAAGAQISSTELLLQQLVSVHDAHALLDLRFRRITSTAFAHRFEKTVHHLCGVAWEVSFY